jgi:hypothetical protein
MTKKKKCVFFTGILKTSTSNKINHYDTPKIYKNNNENIVLKFNGDVKKTVVNQQNNNMNTIDKVSLHSLYVDFFFFFLLSLSLGFFYAYKKNKMKSSFVINCFCLLETRQSD